MDQKSYLEEQSDTVRTKKEVSRERERQIAITGAFQDLIRNPKKTINAVANQNGHLTVFFNGAGAEKNPLLRLVNRANRFIIPITIIKMGEEDILKNDAFKDYKKILNDQGYDIKIDQVKSHSHSPEDGKLLKASFYLSVTASVVGVVTRMPVELTAIPVCSSALFGFFANMQAAPQFCSARIEKTTIKGNSPKLDH